MPQPLLFKKKIGNWPASGWTMEKLAGILAETTLSFRFGKKTDAVVQLETQCEHHKATMREFLSWLDGKNAPSYLPSPQKCWAYSDYNHIMEKFADNTHLHEAVDWSVFGFPGRNGKDSTLWVGSTESYTVCHQDTYGCNLVAQIYGRKRWVLFPPEDGPCLYPSRVPFEESSVFSQVNILRPDLCKHQRFKNARAYVVTLEAGDVLFVPRHWWHFVQSLSPSISINTWIDMPAEDAIERSRESITKCLIYAVMSPLKHKDIWLNPTEEESSPERNLQELNLSLQAASNIASAKSFEEAVHLGKRKANGDSDAPRTKIGKTEEISIAAASMQVSPAIRATSNLETMGKRKANGDSADSPRRKIGKTEVSKKVAAASMQVSPANKTIRVTPFVTTPVTTPQGAPCIISPVTTSNPETIIEKIPGASTLKLHTFTELQQELNGSRGSRTGSSSYHMSPKTALNVANVSGISDSDCPEEFESNSEAAALTVEEVVECLVDREVVELMRKKLQEKYADKKRFC